MVSLIHLKKILTCELIKDLDRVAHNPKWQLFGDFNLTLSQNEKFGGRHIDANLVESFRESL